MCTMKAVLITKDEGAVTVVRKPGTEEERLRQIVAPLIHFQSWTMQPAGHKIEGPVVASIPLPKPGLTVGTNETAVLQEPF